MTRTQLAAIAGITLIVIYSVIMIATSGRAEAQAAHIERGGDCNPNCNRTT